MGHNPFESKADDEVPQAKDLVQDTARVIQVVSKFYGIAEADLYSSRRGFFNEPRNVAVYLARKLRHDKLTQICKDQGFFDQQIQLRQQYHRENGKTNVRR